MIEKKREKKIEKKNEKGPKFLTPCPCLSPLPWFLRNNFIFLKKSRKQEKTREKKGDSEYISIYLQKMGKWENAGGARDGGVRERRGQGTILFC